MVKSKANKASQTPSLEVYSLSGIKIGKYLSWSIALFFVAFIIYFPFESLIKGAAQNALTNIPGCQIGYRSLDLEFFLPKAVLKDVTIPKNCTNTPAPINFNQVRLYFKGMSFMPLGLSTTLVSTLNKEKIEIHQSLGLEKQVIKIDENKISMSTIQKFITMPVVFNGDMTISSQVEFISKKLDEARVNLVSKNLNFPSQTIMGFLLPEIKLNDFSLKAELLNQNSLDVEELIIGDPNSDIRARFKGNIKLNTQVMGRSVLDLKGEVAISNELLNKPEFTLVKTLLQNYNSKNGFYQIGIRGTLANPQPSSL